MTAPRKQVSASLAARGRPENWATENEAAILSGMCPERFRQQVEALETAGFPPVCAWNGKRFIPAILAFWEREHAAIALKKPEPQAQDEAALENWNHDRRPTRQRLPA